METLKLAIALASAYLIGGIPTAYLAGHLVRGIDIRRYGSGNVGATNAGQHLGKPYFVLVAVVDMLLKGMGSVLITRALGLALEAQAMAGLLAAIGHNWSPYLRFSGGRGLAAIGGALLALSWQLVPAALAIALVGGWMARNYALSFGLAVLLLPLGAVALGQSPAVVGFTLGAVAVTVLKRLLSNPGSGAPGLSWRRKALPRLLFDRDTWEAHDWVHRTPLDMPPSNTDHS